MDRRIFIEKKSPFDTHSQLLAHELQQLGWNTQVKIYLIYDIFHLSSEEFEKAKFTVFADPVSDVLHLETPQTLSQHSHVAVEYLPGQFDQRADSAQQALSLITNNHQVQIRTAKLYVFPQLASKDLLAIKKMLINPVDSREKNLAQLAIPTHVAPSEVPSIEGFIGWDTTELEAYYQKEQFAFGFDDLQFIQNYFQKEKRNPTETELKVLDTYWSDHCRHTTFFTELKNISFHGEFQPVLEQVFQKYLSLREQLQRTHKPISLMDMGTIAAKYFHQQGKLNDLVISDEINACTLEIEVEVDGKTEPWYLLFKNETHNHPTEIEPFGGASTCVGGAIRDPLSGRAFVYQAMRVSGAANPLEPISETLEGKLPQRKISKEAALGYSSYGNQIGLATSHIAEVFHPGYKAKRMEVGFVVGAVPKDWVKRETPQPGDKVIVLGGKTGRDGVGGATGSSKTHAADAIETMSAEVQKGDAVQERKIQRLFRNPTVTRLIKKSNDFGAGGVSVAIGEIADGVEVNLDLLPTKYQGLNGTELAISESQERMAVVVAPEDVETFLQEAEKENVLAVVAAEVNDSHRLTILWKGTKIVDLDRTFLDTAGMPKEADATVHLSEISNQNDSFDKTTFLQQLKALNTASQKGLIEHFDATVGQTTALMPLGGKNQLTPALASVHTLPVLGKNTSTVSMASWGFSPQLSEANPFLGASYAVIESVAKLVASGADFQAIRLSFQEYFEKLGNDAQKWGKPVAALLGALDAQLHFEIAAIGGKDSMSGTFQDLHVPPTLISFACAPGNIQQVVSPEFKKSDSYLYHFQHVPNQMGLPDYNQLKEAYAQLHQYIKEGKVLAVQSIGVDGIAVALAKMAIGNDIGCEVKVASSLLSALPGSLLIESSKELTGFERIGQTTQNSIVKINEVECSLQEIIQAYTSTFETLFPTKYTPSAACAEVLQNHTERELPQLKPSPIAQPTVAMPIFAGTNCEFETQKVFEEAGARVKGFVFNNLNANTLADSIQKMKNEIENAQILMLPGGFSLGDEPDGSAKFMVSVLKNPMIQEAVHGLLERDGLILGICNGFQALIKSGLLPYGKICDLSADAPTLTHNQIGRHISQMVEIKVTNDFSPWLNGMKDQTFCVPVSHGEGKFYASDEMLHSLTQKNQIATQYVHPHGEIALEMPFNPNGSVCGIEGITDETGKIYGRMAHPERYAPGLLKNIPDAKFMDIFGNGVKYFH